MKRNAIVPVLLIFVFLFAAGFYFLASFLPHYIEKTVFPLLGDYLSCPVTGKVYSIGLNRAVLGDISVGEGQDLAGRIDSIQVEYRLSSLLEKKLESITVNGLILNLVLAEGKILIPGINLDKLAGTGTAGERPVPADRLTMPITLDKLQIITGQVNISSGRQRIFFPFTLKIAGQERKDSGSLPFYQLDLQVSPQGAGTTVAGTLDLAGNSGEIRFGSDISDVGWLAGLLPKMQEILRVGNVSVAGNADFRLIPFQLNTADVDVKIGSVSLIEAPFIFGMAEENVGEVTPVVLQAGSSDKGLDVAVHIPITKPVASLLDLTGSLARGDGSMHGSGKMSFRLSGQPVAGSDQQFLQLKGEPEMTGDFAFDVSSSGVWQAKLESNRTAEDDAKTEPVKIQYHGNILAARLPAVVLHGNGSAGSHEISTSLDFSTIHITGEDATEIRIPQAKLQASFSLASTSEQENLASGAFTLLLPDMVFTRNGLSGKTMIRLEGSMDPQVLQDMKTLRAAGFLSARNGSLADLSSQLQIGLIDMQIPWHWPLTGQEKTGKIRIEQVSWNDKELGNLTADVGLKDSVYSAKGRFQSLFVKGITTRLDGTAAITDEGVLATILLHADPTQFTSLPLGRIDPALNNSYLSGKMGLEGSFQLEAKGLQGGLTVSLQDGRYEFPDKKIEVNGISMGLQLPSLPDLRSTPAQKITFDKGSFGNLLVEKGEIVWQLESVDTLLIEEGVIQWSGGRVFTNAVRISPSRKEFVVPIFCDRLILADILRQFGISNAEGDGTVSGRIPLMVGKGNIRVEDGFLYSSPGQGGSIKVAAFDLLSAGIPKNTPQFAQIDFAAEALKNFKYNWVKLLLNSEGDDLIMQMQMDGKPLQSLPFTYDTQTGLLQRMEDSGKGIDQPIRLDVNFRLPLKRFLGYSGKIQDIMKKIK